MHFHLPKPLHGWREFAGEVGIIVIGVLIALAAEAVVQDIQWRNRVHSSLNALASDMQDNYFGAAEIAVTQPCVDAQLAQIEQTLSRPGPWRPLPVYVRGPLRFVVRAPVRTWTSNVWQAMNNEGVSSHVDRPLRLGIEAFYTTTAYLSAQQSDAAKLNWGLTALGQQAAPDAGQRFQLVRDIEQMRGNFQLLKVVANQALGRVDSIGIGKEDPAKLQSFLATSGTVAFCRERHLPLGKLDPIAPTDIKQMHFHLPKPLHGWREFAGEVGIIVLGVLIALGAEQAVEWLHWRNEVADARRALDRELAYDLGAVVKRQQEGPCIDRRLHEIRALLTGSSSGLGSAPRSPLGQPQLWRPRTNVWQATMAAQVAEHMPLTARLGYADLYGGLQWYAQQAVDETVAWSVLGELDDPGELGPEDIAAVRQARSRAQVAADKVDAYLPRIIAAGERLGIKPGAVDETPLTAAAIKSLCQPLAPTGKAA